MVLVFCDITTSVDGKSIDRSIEKLKSLMASLPTGAKVKVFPIDNNDYPEKLVDYEIPNCKNPDLTGRLAEKFEEKCKEDISLSITEFGKSIKVKYDQLAQNAEIHQRSCIINTLDKVHETFKNVDKNRYIFHTVYLSDMIEECRSPVGSLFMCSKKKAPDKNAMLKDIRENYNPAFNLKETVGQSVSIVISTQLMGSDDYKCVFPNEQKDLWKEVFIKAGYSGEDFSLIPFSSELPPTFTGKEKESQ